MNTTTTNRSAPSGPGKAPPRPAASEPQAPAVQPKRSSRTVTVASKLPMSIELQLCKPVTKQVPGRYGVEDETTHMKTGAVYVIRGMGYPEGQTPKGFPRRPELIEAAGYALTPGIPEDWFAEWLRQNAETDKVQNGIIKAHAQPESLHSMAMEHADVPSGLQPMAQDGDPRAPRPLNALVEPVKPVTDKAGV